MFLITHAASAISAAAAIDVYRMKRQMPRLFSDLEYLLIGFCSLIPDLFWPDGYGPFKTGFMLAHSLLPALPLFALLFMLTRMLSTSKDVLFKTFVFWLAYLSHIAWDCVSGGKALLYPLSDSVIGFSFLPITYWFVLDGFFLVLTVLAWRAVRRCAGPQ